MKLQQIQAPILFVLMALVIAARADAEVRTFRNPMHQGFRLDYCQAFGRVCGERVATQWCRGQGYEYASDWTIDRSIGAVQPTIQFGDQNVCKGDQCSGFADITCGREGRTFRLPDLGAATRATVITPDRRGTAPTIKPIEVQILVPGCQQREPGVLLCESVHEFQHCRTLLRDGQVLGCRAGLAFDGAFAEPRAAAEGSYELSMRSRAMAVVHEGQRGDGRVRGDARYSLRFAIPDSPGAACLQRDRYVYHPAGPQGGMSQIDATAACDEPIEGEFAAHEDDLLHAYDLCEARNAWGEELEHSIDLLVAGLYHFAAPTAAQIPAPGSSSYIIAPYLTVRAPFRISCKD